MHTDIKKILIIIGILVTCNGFLIANVQDSLIYELQDSLTSINIQYNRILTKNKIVLDSVNELIGIQNDKILEIEKDSYESKVEFYKWLIWGILAVFGIFFPILFYLTSVIPSQKAAREARKLVNDTKGDLVKLINEHLTTKVSDSVDRALEGLDKDDSRKIYNTTILNSSFTEDFSDSQLLKMIKIIKTTKHRYTKEVLGNILPHKDNYFVDEYFLDILKNRAANADYHRAIIYFTQFNKFEYIDDIVKLMTTNYLEIQSYFPQIQTEEYLLRILNHDFLVNNLPDEIILKNGTSFFHTSNFYPQIDKEAKIKLLGTKLIQKFNELALNNDGFKRFVIEI